MRLGNGENGRTGAAYATKEATCGRLTSLCRSEQLPGNSGRETQRLGWGGLGCCLAKACGVKFKGQAELPGRASVRKRPLACDSPAPLFELTEGAQSHATGRSDAEAASRESEGVDRFLCRKTSGSKGSVGQCGPKFTSELLTLGLGLVGREEKRIHCLVPLSPCFLLS